MPFVIGVLFAVCLVCFLIVLDARWIRRLPALAMFSTSDALAQAPSVSIIIPARNEAGNIARCLDGALAQRYPDFEVVVVDDGSTDATPHILAGYTARYPGCLRMIQGRALPPGWVGKCNACFFGAEHACRESEWLLFLDADTAPQPALLDSLMTFVRARGLDAASVLPFNELPTLAERLVIPVFFQFAFTAFPLKWLLDPDMPPNNAMANGQCLLVRTSAYWSVGGHAAVKDKVLEDIEFAQALRRAGFRLGIATAFDQLRVRMYRSLGEIVQGLGKHASAGRRVSGWRAFWAVLRLTLTILLPPLLLAACLIRAITQPDDPGAWLSSGIAALGCAASVWFWQRRYRTWYGLPGWLSLLTPLGWLIYLYIVVHSTLRVLLKRGVTWKGRIYSS